ncbi:DEAD/DEAH box helicase family protein [Rhodocyclaceae bacterium]
MAKPATKKPESGHIRLQKNLRLKSALAHDLGVDAESIMKALRSLEAEHGAQSCSDEGRFIAAAKSKARVECHSVWDDLDLRVMDACRKAGFTPRYFQYLALVFAARNFDRALANADEWLCVLNAQDDTAPAFTPEDLRLSAFWMATSAGKTHLLHACLHLLGRAWDRILILTPSETLTEQHARKLRETRQFDVFAYPMDGDAGMLGNQSSDTILVMDINKLSKNKTGDGVTLDISVFDGGKNLVFVDEGHKGGATEESVWKDLQRTLAGLSAPEKDRGLLVEFSATFGQIVDKGGLFDDYTKSIVFDYPYDRFMSDLYGKFPVARTATGLSQGSVLAASLLAYWRQWSAWKDADTQAQIKAIGMEIPQPLWVLLGLSVIGSKPKGQLNEGDKAQTTEVVDTICFLNRILCRDGIDRLAEFIDAARAATLTECKGKSRDLATRIVHDLFGWREGATFVARTLKSSSKELALGLAAGDKTNYFGVVNVGEPGKLADLLRPHGIDVAVDIMVTPLFERLEHHESPLRILIGSRRFAEGWDSYRPSTLTLLNLGQKEGSLIIQMFGRAVRFHGIANDGKRLAAPSELIQPLQTAYIFGLKADYLTAFIENLRANGIDIEPQTYRVRKDVDDSAPVRMVVAADPAKDAFHVVLRSKTWLRSVSKVTLSLGGAVTSAAISQHDGTVSSERIRLGQDITHVFRSSIDLLDFDAIYLDMLAWRANKRWWNLSFDHSVIRTAIESDKYVVTGLPDSLDTLDRIQSAATVLVRQMLMRAYRKHEAKHVRYDFAPVSSGAPIEYWIGTRESA